MTLTRRPPDNAASTTAASRAGKPTAPATPSATSVAARMGPLLARLVGVSPSVRFVFWDGSMIGPADSEGAVVIRRSNALRHLLWAPGELGLARAFVGGDIDVEGNIIDVVEALSGHLVKGDVGNGPVNAAAAVSAALRLRAVGPPLPPPPEEIRPHGIRHSKRRDARAISHHYDVGNDFYRIVLGEAMTYSCARFTRDDATLAEAQAAKHELICLKLGLADLSEPRLLDVGCGWASMAIHAARHHDARVVAITISAEQAGEAKRRVDEAGLSDRVDIRLQDYRDLDGEQFDAISSIGMFEHVGMAKTAEYFNTLHGLLRPEGRLLNHAISSVGGSRLGRRSFMNRYVFPDGELQDVGDTVLAMERAGFEVRDVESLREHYALTLRQWVANLEQDWDRAVELVGEGRARVWRLYMGASAIGFEDGGVNIHQILGVVPDECGRSGMPRTRDGWSTS
jgi:cyclopropane-fatty-acyl-phospholipid synthase